MQTFLMVLFLVVAFVVGNAMILIRTAKPPKIPEGVKPPSCTDDANS
jgi:hypothetical protein